MVPEGWERRDLNGFIEIKHGFAFKSSYFSDSGKYVLLTPGSFHETGGFREQGSKTKYYKGIVPAGYLLQKGALLIAMTEQAEGLLGSALVVPEDRKYLHNQRLGLVKIIQAEKVCRDFLYLFFNTPANRKQIKEQATGTKVKHTSPDRLVSVIGLIPPIAEQKRISQLLSTWDKAITTTEQLLANSQKQKKALMQQLLTGKKRLLDENGVRFSGDVKRLRIAEIGKIVSGGTPNTNNSEYWKGDIPWVTPTDVTALKSRFVKSTSRTISEAGLKSSSATLIPSGSLMVCTRATVGALAISKGNMTTNQGFKNIIPSKNHSVEFLYYLLSFYSHELVRKASGSTFLELSKKDFEKIELFVPRLSEQKAIALILSLADSEIATLMEKVDALKQEKKALMQQLLLGKRRVNIKD